MKLVDLKFQPGIDKQDTAYSAGDQRKYVDSNLVRFHYGKPERWKGWSYLPDPNKTVVGVVRDTHSWIGLDGTRYLALGTDRKLYLFLLVRFIVFVGFSDFNISIKVSCIGMTI